MTETGEWTPVTGLTPGMRLPVRTITVPSMPFLRIAFGEPKPPGVSGVTVAAFMPKPHPFIPAAAPGTHTTPPPPRPPAEPPPLAPRRRLVDPPIVRRQPVLQG